MLGIAGRTFRTWVIATLAAFAALVSLLFAVQMQMLPARAFGNGPIAVQAPLPLTSRVVDAAKVLSPDRQASLTLELKQLELDTKVQFAVVTTRSLGRLTVAQYGLALGNSWRLGDKVRNDGLILLVAPNERKVRIEVGLGPEARLPDAYCATVVQHMLPSFRTGDLAQGIQIGVDDLAARVRQTTVKAAA